MKKEDLAWPSKGIALAIVPTAIGGLLCFYELVLLGMISPVEDDEEFNSRRCRGEAWRGREEGWGASCSMILEL